MNFNNNDFGKIARKLTKTFEEIFEQLLETVVIGTSMWTINANFGKISDSRKSFAKIMGWIRINSVEIMKM